MGLIIGLLLFALLIAAAFFVGGIIMGTIWVIVSGIAWLFRKVVGWNAR